MKQGYKEFVKYGIVGVVGLVIDMGLYYLLVDVFHTTYPIAEGFGRLLSWFGVIADAALPNILISSIISSSLAVINNFLLNSYFTFKVKDNKLKRFLPFAGIAIVGMVVSTILLTVMIDHMGINKLVAKAVSIFIVAMMQFLLNKYFTFKKKAV